MYMAYGFNQGSSMAASASSRRTHTGSAARCAIAEVGADELAIALGSLWRSCADILRHRHLAARSVMPLCRSVAAVRHSQRTTSMCDCVPQQRHRRREHDY